MQGDKTLWGDGGHKFDCNFRYCRWVESCVIRITESVENSKLLTDPFGKTNVIRLKIHMHPEDGTLSWICVVSCKQQQ